MSTKAEYKKRVMPFVFEDTTPFEEGQIACEMGIWTHEVQK